MAPSWCYDLFRKKMSASSPICSEVAAFQHCIDGSYTRSNSARRGSSTNVTSIPPVRSRSWPRPALPELTISWDSPIWFSLAIDLRLSLLSSSPTTGKTKVLERPSRGTKVSTTEYAIALDPMELPERPLMESTNTADLDGGHIAVTRVNARMLGQELLGSSRSEQSRDVCMFIGEGFPESGPTEIILDIHVSVSIQ